MIEDQLKRFEELEALAACLGVIGLRDREAKVVGTGSDSRVVLFFSHDAFLQAVSHIGAGAGRGRIRREPVSEELAAGALDRMMGCDAPRPRNGVVWTRLRGAALGEDDDAIAPKLGPRAIA